MSPESRTIQQSLTINRSPRSVFDALTLATELETWFPTRAESDPREGGFYRFTFENVDAAKNHVQEGRYRALVPGERVLLDWEMNGTKTQVQVRILGRGDQTTLELTHTGFEDEALCAHYETGWAKFLGNLKSVLESGKDRRLELLGVKSKAPAAKGSPVIWFEIGGHDTARLASYYDSLFGWAIDTQNPMGYGYVKTGSDEGIGGGIAPSKTGKGSIVFYVKVGDVGNALARAVELGGKIVVPPTEVPGIVTFAQFADPEGNLMGLVKG